MKIEKLMDGNDTLNVYTKFVNEIKNGRALTNFNELEKYRDNLKLIFTSRSFLNRGSLNEGDVDMAVTLVKELGDIKLNKKIIETLENNMYCHFGNLINGLAFLYKPTIMMDDFEIYFRLSDKIFLNSIYAWFFSDIDTGNEELDKVYTYIKHICLDREEIYNSFIRNRAIQFIFGCVHYYNEFSDKLIDELYNDLGYYLNKLLEAGCNIFENGANYNIDQAKYIFEHFNEIFSKEQIFIR